MTTKILYSVPVTDKSLQIGKFPGYKLVRKLEKYDCFEVVLVPATLTGAEKISDKIYLFLDYLTKTILTIFNFRDDIYFYNFQKSYVPIYILYLLFHLKRPNLFLADGVNCFGLRRVGHRKFFDCFYKIISLPYLSDYLEPSNDRILWFPGPLEFYQNRNYKKKQNSVFVYNSSLLWYNEPERAIDLAIQNHELEIFFTGTRQAMQDYLNMNNLDHYLEKLDNLNFTGDLTQKEYLDLLESADGVLLFRNEEYFENQYNFPSKLLECLQLGVPLISFYRINGVPESIYSHVTNYNEIGKLNKTKKAIPPDDMDAVEFLNRCNPKTLKDFM